ncbi:putative TPR repeat methyltransferase [Thiogranum longum]|uniref:Putative TPR repeat methyltransferase n=1 Tax=Thiogranum longum TaxID=1537524 RepID=A0A4V2PH15_9GAMM|nr:tetratricopeptide repeat protein [Thiogranum longum]TCK19016.1 putative TPR repeat methyltransferase [Thiogranum longum]
MTSVVLNNVTLARAVEAYRDGRLDDAQQLFLDVLQLEPGNPDALYFMSMIDQQAGRLEVAEHRAKELLGQKPEDGKALNLLGTIQMSRVLLDDASETFARGVRVDVSNPILRVNAAICQMALVNPQGAVALCREALAIQPGYANAYNIMGTAQLAQGEPEDAAESFRKAFELKPDFQDALFNYGKALLDLRKYGEALDCFNSVLDKECSHVHALTRRADILAARGDYQGAEAGYSTALENNSRFTPAYIGMGKLHQSMDRQETALGFFKRAIELDSANVEALMLAGDAFRKLNQLEASAAAFRDVLDIDPDNFQAQFHLAAVNGNTPPAKPDNDYVQRLFDEFADNFDSALGKVDYNAPEQLRELAEVYLDSGLSGGLDILDLGCGTGLSGISFKSLSGRLKGVDISQRMIDKARKRGIYDELENNELLTSLVRHQNDTDLAICADTFPYIGDLESYFLAVFSALRANGLFLFSVETHQGEDDYKLNATARYAHSGRYVRELARRRGFEFLGCNQSSYRKEAGHPVESLIVALRKTA